MIFSICCVSDFPSQSKSMFSAHSLYRWTRDGFLTFPWTQYETPEQLILHPDLREQILNLTQRFQASADPFHKHRLVWRQGLLISGPSGSGKSAVARAIARILSWSHVTLPEHEVLDSHHFERALSLVTSQPHTVVVLENIDRMIARMDPEIFFSLLDFAMERGQGIFWVATSRHPELLPKSQLLRPGRMDDLLRVEHPDSNMREIILREIFKEFEIQLLSENDFQELLAQTENLSFAHFIEMRRIAARALTSNNPEEAYQLLLSYLQDQLLQYDRLGGLSDVTQEALDRAKQVDPRLLLAALQQTDIYKTVIEKVLVDYSVRGGQSMSDSGQASMTSGGPSGNA